MALLDRKQFGWRDLVMFACVAAVVIISVRAEHVRDEATDANRRGAVLVAVAVCQQANILVAASLAKKTPAERRELRPLITQYLDPLNRALVALGHSPNCDAD